MTRDIWIIVIGLIIIEGLLLDSSIRVIYQEYTQFRGVIPTIGKITSFTSENILECSRNCTVDNVCRSFLFGNSLGYTYSLYMTKTMDTISATGIRYYTPRRSCINSGYVYNDNPRMCYKVSDVKLDALTAMEYCLDRGGGLVRMNTHEEIEVIRKAIDANNIEPKIFWIGLNDIDTEGIFKWWDGRIAEPTSWHPYQPDNISDPINEYYADCVIFGTWNSSKPVNWWDRTCTNTQYFICELTLSEE